VGHAGVLRRAPRFQRAVSARERRRAPLVRANWLRVGATPALIFLSPEIPDEVERVVSGEREQEIPESVLTTLLFTDIVGSTEKAAELGDRAWRDLLERHHALIRRELSRFRGVEQDTAGDGFFATFDGPARAIRCAQALIEGVRELGLEIRASVHTGECELHDGKPSAIALNIGARAAAGEILVTSTVRDLVAGTGLAFENRGDRELKGILGTRHLYVAVL
jgi:class 3 adenylate cyclase